MLIACYVLVASIMSIVSARQVTGIVRNGVSGEPFSDVTISVNGWEATKTDKFGVYAAELMDS